MTEEKKKRIEEIDKRIEDLNEHRKMWAQAGGRGLMMATQAERELQELKLERDDLINGTNTLEIFLAEKKLQQLTYQKMDAFIIKKIIIANKIKKLEKEITTLKRK